MNKIYGFTILTSLKFTLWSAKNNIFNPKILRLDSCVYFILFYEMVKSQNPIWCEVYCWCSFYCCCCRWWCSLFVPRYCFSQFCVNVLVPGSLVSIYCFTLSLFVHTHALIQQKTISKCKNLKHTFHCGIHQFHSIS